MFICNSPNFLHAIPLFIWVTSAWCNKNRPKGLCLWTWPTWPLLHSWGLEGAKPCSTYHASKRSHSISRLLCYKWRTYNNVCYFRLLIAKSSAAHLWCHWDTLPWTSAMRMTVCTSFSIQILSSLHTLLWLPLPFWWCVYWKTWFYCAEHQLLAPQLVILISFVKALKLTNRQKEKGWHFSIHQSISRES